MKKILLSKLNPHQKSLKASNSVAEKVAELLAQERGLDENWQREQVASFKKLAENYLGN